MYFFGLIMKQINKSVIPAAGLETRVLPAALRYTALWLFTVTALIGSISCEHPVENPIGEHLPGSYVLVPLHHVVRIQKDPDWSIRLDAIDPTNKTCTVAVISAIEATPAVATLREDGLLPDIPGRKDTQTGSVVQIRPDVIKVWIKLQ
jgi:hypothetical protein